MTNEQTPGQEQTPEEIIKELATEMEREEGDGEATREDLLVSLDYTDRYGEALRSDRFWELVEAGMYSVKDRWGTSDRGEAVLCYLEIRDKDGKILLMEDFQALNKIAEENRRLVEPPEMA